MKVYLSWGETTYASDAQTHMVILDFHLVSFLIIEQIQYKQTRIYFPQHRLEIILNELLNNELISYLEMWSVSLE